MKIQAVIFCILMAPFLSVQAELPVFLEQYDNEWIDFNAVSKFYKNNDRLWLNKGRPTNQAYDALDFIASASIHGLNSNHYHLSALRKLDPSISLDAAQKFEGLLTDGLLALIHDLAVGRLEAHVADPEWFIPQPSFDAAEFLHEALLFPYLKIQLSTLIPTTGQYVKLTEALARYQGYADQGGWFTIPDGPLIRPSNNHQSIPAIQARLAIEDNQFQPRSSVEFERYDVLTEQAVRRFQKRHGLKVDGVIGNETRSELNIPALDRVQQIKVVLERQRWMPANLGVRYVQVNLANYTLSAVDNNAEKLSMRVIVGKNDRQTPSFKSYINHLVVNPYWNVPRNLAILDLLPKQKVDSDYFKLHDIRVFINENGHKVEQEPYLIDWQSVSKNDFPYILRQEPGEHNALGLIKFLFPNPWAIYLHDSPHKELFAEAKRNLSSGCIRVEDPLGFADFSLSDIKEYQNLSDIILSKENKGLKLTEPLAIYAVYFTVSVNGDEVLFSPDSYQRDRMILEKLNKSN